MSRVFDRDFLSVMNEDDLRAKIVAYKNAIEADKRRGRDTQDLEVEYCYLWTEAETRDKRRAAHEEYVRNNPSLFDQEDDYSYEDDAGLYS
jgi:hypothetical protein